MGEVTMQITLALVGVTGGTMVMLDINTNFPIHFKQLRDLIKQEIYRRFSFGLLDENISQIKIRPKPIADINQKLIDNAIIVNDANPIVEKPLDTSVITFRLNDSTRTPTNVVGDLEPVLLKAIMDGLAKEAAALEAQNKLKQANKKGNEEVTVLQQAIPVAGSAGVSVATMVAGSAGTVVKKTPSALNTIATPLVQPKSAVNTYFFASPMMNSRTAVTQPSAGRKMNELLTAEMLTLLPKSTLKNGDIDAVFDLWDTPLSWAIRNNFKLAVALIEAGANMDGHVRMSPYGRPEYEGNPLAAAVRKYDGFHPPKTSIEERARLTSLLIQRKADIAVTWPITGLHPSSLFSQHNIDYNYEPFKVLLGALYVQTLVQPNQKVVDLMNSKMKFDCGRVYTHYT